MKNLVFILLLTTLNSVAITIKFERLDSINFKGEQDNPKGKSATIKIKDQFFQIGVFEFNDPNGYDDGAPIYRFIAIYHVNSKKHSFYENYHYANSLRLRNLKYLYLEGEYFYIKSISSDSMILEKRDLDFNVINDPGDICLKCIYNLNFFDSKFLDSNKNKIASTQLFSPDKLNVVYFTIDHCAPCEELKPEIIKLYTAKKINLTITTPDFAKYPIEYDSIPRKFYFKDANLNRHGYPNFLIFDKAGNLIPSAQIKEGAITYIKNYLQIH